MRSAMARILDLNRLIIGLNYLVIGLNRLIIGLNRPPVHFIIHIQKKLVEEAIHPTPYTYQRVEEAMHQ